LPRLERRYYIWAGTNEIALSPREERWTPGRDQGDPSKLFRTSKGVEIVFQGKRGAGNDRFPKKPLEIK